MYSRREKHIFHIWAGTFWVADGIFFFPSYLIGWRTCNKWLKLHVETIIYYTANFWCWLNWIVTGIKQKGNTTLFKIRNLENLIWLKIPASGQFIKSFRVWQISKGPLLLCSLKIIQKFQSVNQPLMLSPMVYFMLYPSELIWFQSRLLVYNMADTWSRIYATTQQLSDSGTVCKLMIISWDIDALVRMPEGSVVRKKCE